MIAAIGDYINKAQNFYVDAEKRMSSAAKNLVPGHLHELADKVARAVPEILCSLSLLTGVLKPVAMIYGGVKVIWSISPMVHTLVTGGDMAKARIEAADRLYQSYEKFKPAIFVSFAVTAAASAVLGLASLSPTLLLSATFLGIISKLGYDSCQPAAALQEGVVT